MGFRAVLAGAAVAAALAALNNNDHVAVMLNDDPTDGCAVLGASCVECALREGCGFCGDGEYALAYRTGDLVSDVPTAGARVGGWIFKQRGLDDSAAPADPLAMQVSGRAGRQAASRLVGPDRLLARRQSDIGHDHAAAAAEQPVLLQMSSSSSGEADIAPYHLGCFNVSRVLSGATAAAALAAGGSAVDLSRFNAACRDFRTDPCDCSVEDDAPDATVPLPQCQAVASAVRAPPLIIATAVLLAGGIIGGIVALHIKMSSQDGRGRGGCGKAALCQRSTESAADGAGDSRPADADGGNLHVPSSDGAARTRDPPEVVGLRLPAEGRLLRPLVRRAGNGGTTGGGEDPAPVVEPGR